MIYRNVKGFEITYKGVYGIRQFRHRDILTLLYYIQKSSQ